MFNLDPILKKRINAFTIDLGIIVVVNYFLMASFTDFLKIIFFHFPLSTQLVLVHKFKYVHSISMLALTFSYFSVFYFCTNGQTMGKMMMNLRVKTKNAEMTLTDSMKRAISYIFCVWFASIPFALSFVRKDHKSVADLFSNSEVCLDETSKIIQSTEFQLTIADYINNPENIYEEAEVVQLHNDSDSEEDKAA